MNNTALDVRRLPASAEGMRGASTQISVDLLRALRRRQRTARVLLPLRMVDDLLDDLERLNLTGRRRVPTAWEPRIARLKACLPGEVRNLPELRTNILAIRLMDGLYELEDQLLDLKVGPLRAELAAFDAATFGVDDEKGSGDWAVA